MKRSDSTRPILRGVLLMLISSFFHLRWAAFLETICDRFRSVSSRRVRLYGVGALLMLLAMNYGDLSVLHPMLGAGYVLSFVLGRIFLQESISVMKMIGLLAILLGLILIVRSGVKEP